MAEYFGNQNNNATDDQGGRSLVWNNATYQCPGSGSFNVQELSCYCYSTAAVNLLLGIYDTSGNLVGEGTAKVAMQADGGSPTWQGHMTEAAVKAAGGSSPCVLTGGTSYYLAVYTDALSSASYVRYDNAGVGIRFVSGGDNLTAMPATLPAYSSASNMAYAIRCGVDPAGGVTLDQEGFRFRNDDGDEAGASWAADQDVGLTAPVDQNKRLRFIVNATGDPGAKAFQLEYKKSTDSQWIKVT